MAEFVTAIIVILALNLWIPVCMATSVIILTLAFWKDEIEDR